MDAVLFSVRKEMSLKTSRGTNFNFQSTKPTKYSQEREKRGNVAGVLFGIVAPFVVGKVNRLRYVPPRIGV
jgi:hypothetical protein